MTVGFGDFGGDTPLHFREFFDYLYKKYGGGIPTKPTKPHPSPTRSMTLTKTTTRHLRDPLNALYV